MRIEEYKSDTHGNGWIKLLAGVVYGLIIGFALGALVFYRSDTTKPKAIEPSQPAMAQMKPAEPEAKSAPIKNTMLHAFMYSLIRAESDFRHSGFKGSSGERGYTQVRKCTWIDGCKYLRVKWSYDNVWVRQKNITVATGYICWLFDRWHARGYRGDKLVEKACNSYNLGFSNVLNGKWTAITYRHYSRFRRTFDYVMETEKYRHGSVKKYIDNAVEFVKAKKELKWLK